MDGMDVVFGNELGHGSAIRERAEFEPKVALAQAEMIKDWLGALGCDVANERLGIGSLRRIERDVRPWQIYLEEIGCPDPTRSTVVDFLEEQGKRYRPNTVNNRRDTLAGLYSWAQSQKPPRYPDIAGSIPRLTRASATLPPESFDGDLVLALLALMGRKDLRDLRNRAIVGLVGSGLETVSIRNALIGDVDCLLGQMRYQPRRHLAKDAVILLRPEVGEALREYIGARVAAECGDPGAPLITPSYDLNVPLSTLSMRLLIRRLADGLGVGRGRLTTTALRAAGLGEMTQRIGVGGVVQSAHMSRDSLRRMMKRMEPKLAG